MNIVFMGTPEFAVPSLNILVSNGFNVSAVVTVPDKKQGRGLKMQNSAVKEFALNQKIEVLQPESLREPEFIYKLKSFKPDLFIIVAFRILPPEVYKIPSRGAFNLHASLLPKYRGAAPINWAIIKGEKETGVTTFFLQDKVDTGNILLQRKIEIKDSENAGTLHDKLSLLGANTVLDTVQLIASDNLTTIYQDDKLATKAPKIFKEDCRINWSKSDVITHNLIRGLSPYPAAFTTLEGKIVKIYESALTSYMCTDDTGSISISGRKIFSCASGKMLEIIELQAEGKKRMKAPDFINGLHKTSGLKFE